jgi:hypothetical protein
MADFAATVGPLCAQKRRSPLLDAPKRSGHDRQFAPLCQPQADEHAELASGPDQRRWIRTGKVARPATHLAAERPSKG